MKKNKAQRVANAHEKGRTVSVVALAGGSVPGLSAVGLIQEWRQAARDAMAMARHHDKNKNEDDRYRWFRVGQTFRYCANRLRRQMVAKNKRQPAPNKADMASGNQS